MTYPCPGCGSLQGHALDCRYHPAPELAQEVQMLRESRVVHTTHLGAKNVIKQLQDRIAVLESEIAVLKARK